MSAEFGVRSAELKESADVAGKRQNAVKKVRMTMKNENLKQRTKKFGLNIITLVEKLPRNLTCDVLGRQLLRSATSVGANYRAACRAKSSADFISKMGTVEEEADESGFWLEMLVDAGKLRLEQAKDLLQESGELTAISVASINAAKKSSSAKENGRTAGHSALRTPRSAFK
jgi:four helix bundle protein